MRPKSPLTAVVLGVAALTFALAPISLAQDPNLDTAAIEQATGLKGQLIAEENVFKVSRPRTDC